MANILAVELTQEVNDYATDYQKILGREESVLLDEIITGYRTWRLYARRHEKKSVDENIRIFLHMVKFLGSAPWWWNEDDFIKWCEYIATKPVKRGGKIGKCGPATERKYQNAIKNTLRFLAENPKFRTKIGQKFQVRPKQICTKENCIPHRLEEEVNNPRPTFSHMEMKLIFEAIDELTLEAYNFHSKSLNPLRRDKALLTILYACALRAHEVLGMNIHSFSPNPFAPELGNYGFAHVMGKGSNGSGKKPGIIPVTDLRVARIMEWYLAEVRPTFLTHADPNETALFLNERGKRLSSEGLRERLDLIMDKAGLVRKYEDGRYTLHSFRRAGGSHEATRMSTHGIKEKLRHSNLHTTGLYLNFSDEFSRVEISESLYAQLDAIDIPDKKGGQNG